MAKKQTLNKTSIKSEVIHERYDEKDEDSLETSLVPVKIYHNIETLNAQISSMTEKIYDNIYKWKCTVCGKLSANKQEIMRHVEVHIEGASHPCNQCGKTSRSSSALRKHKSSNCLSQ